MIKSTSCPRNLHLRSAGKASASRMLCIREGCLTQD